LKVLISCCFTPNRRQVWSEETGQGRVRVLGPPEGRARAQGGVWVIGMIRGTAAARAGVEQGDQLLAVDGAALDGATPFQAANLLMGAAEDGAAAVPSVTVTARARRPCDRHLVCALCTCVLLPEPG